VHSRVGAAAKLEGRDLSYLLPAMPIRVLSLVPADASDIRDSAEASLGVVQALRTRSRTFRVVAYALGALAVVMAIVALLPLARRARTSGDRAPRLAPGRLIADRATMWLTETQRRAAREGWNDDRLSEMLSALRLITASALGHQISQKDLPADGKVPEGRLLVEYGFPRRIRATVCSAVTADDVIRALSGTHQFSTTQTQQLEMLRSALSGFTGELYRRPRDRDAEAGVADTGGLLDGPEMLDESVLQLIKASRGER
jgi:hypothetical protein